MSVRFTGYGGIGEIGGNKLLLEDGDWQILFDFGMSFGSISRYFEEFLQPRIIRGLTDYLRTGLLPPLEGLYRPDLNTLPEHATIWDRIRLRPGHRTDINPRGILLSHAHADHVGYVSMLHPDIPIISSAKSALIAKATQDGGQNRLDGQTVFLQPRKASGSILVTDPAIPVKQRQWRITDEEAWTPDASTYWAQRYAKARTTHTTHDVLPAERVMDGHEIRTYSTDHSIPGTIGFAVETSAGWVGYTGDIRIHGRQSNTTLDFAHELAELDLVALICEGTQAGHAPGASEEDVRARVIERVHHEQGLVIADFGPRNIERLETFLEAARLTNRQLVITMKDALLLRALHTIDPTVPIPSSPHGPLIYDDVRTTSTAWQEAIIDEFAHMTVSSDRIRTDIGGYILCFSFFDVARLLDLGEISGTWIYSSSEPYNEEAVLDMERLRNWTALLGLEFAGSARADEAEMTGFHASGHAGGVHLQQFVEIANPRTLIPVHLESDGLAFYRETFEHSTIEVRTPRCGHSLRIE